MLPSARLRAEPVRSLQLWSNGQREPFLTCPQIAAALPATASPEPILGGVDEVVTRLRAGGGVLARREHRELAGPLDRLLRTGTLVALLPGVYCPPELAADLRVQALGALLWAGADAVLTGLTAAGLTYWPSAPAAPVTLALPTTTRRSRVPVRVERRTIPPELVLRRPGLVVTCPSATAVDLAATDHGGAAIDEALRTRAATLDQLWTAFAAQPDRPGNLARRALLQDSRDEPWSEAERECHRLLRQAGITGWGPTNPWRDTASTCCSAGSGWSWRSTAGRSTATGCPSSPTVVDATRWSWRGILSSTSPGCSCRTTPPGWSPRCSGRSVGPGI